MHSGAMVVTRSEIMARVRATHTEPELALRSALWSLGLRYRLHARVEGIRPDLVFKGRKAAVFVDGCFWHGCPKHYSRPRSHSAYWADKLAANVERDHLQTTRLEAAGWRVLRVWEHELWENMDAVASEVVAVVEDPQWSSPQSWRVLHVAEVEGDANQERRTLCLLRDLDVQRDVIGPRVSGKARPRRKRGG